MSTRESACGGTSGEAVEVSSERVLELARTLWDYLRLGEPVAPGDAILVFGGVDLRSADWGAKLWLDGLAPLLVFSGGRGPLTRTWEKTEAETFAERALALGVPADRIVLETRSTNTGENVRFTRALFEERGRAPERWILVHTPHLERRARATFRHYWPGKPFSVTSPPIAFEEYPADGVPIESLVHRLVGELHRLMEYPRRGYQAPEPEEIPDEVLSAWRELVARGFTRSLV